MIYILIAIEIVLTIFYITGLVWLIHPYKAGNWFYHDIMEWHKPCEKESFDGASFHSYCKFCGKEIMQDSQGNWFCCDIHTDDEERKINDRQ